MSTSQEDPLVRRVRRARHALGVTRDEAVEAIYVQHAQTERGHATFVDFNQGRTQEDLETVAYSLVANIASLRDHLKSWCRTNGVPYKGDALINRNNNVAILHDLWNVDKHAELNRTPRSGHKPLLTRLRQSMMLSTGSAARSSVIFTFAPRIVQPVVYASDGGGAELVFDGQIIDEHGTDLGTLQGLCKDVLDAWEAEMAASGLVLPNP